MSLLQRPISSGFDANTTAEQAIAGVSLVGRRVIITGGYAGIGLETVRVLVDAGAEVIVGARDMKKARANLAAIPSVEILPLDLIDPRSVDAFAEGFVSRGVALHLLINNAGVMANPLTRDARGYESQFATNHLGHFQLTAKLFPALVAAKGARVINVSSRGHRFSPVVLEDVNFDRRPYEKWQAYGQSKTANILFSVELDRRGKSLGVRSFGLHPGAILQTDLARHLGKDDLKAFGISLENGQIKLDPGVSFTFKSVPEGAATTVWAATSRQLDGAGGLYLEDCDVAAINGAEDFNHGGVRPYAIDGEVAKQLWAISEKMTKTVFPG